MRAQGIKNDYIDIAVIELGLGILGEGGCGDLGDVQCRVDELLRVIIVAVIVLGGKSQSSEQARMQQHMPDVIYLPVEPARAQHNQEETVDFLYDFELQLTCELIVGQLVQNPYYSLAEDLNKLGALGQDSRLLDLRAVLGVYDVAH